jgi:hypothetical protein
MAHFQDLSKYDTLVLVRVLDLTKTRTTLDKKMFLSRIFWTQQVGNPTSTASQLQIRDSKV